MTRQNTTLTTKISPATAALKARIAALPDYEAVNKREALIDRIHDLMETQKISRAELARRMGVTRGYVTQVLSGNAKNFTLDTLVKLGEAFGQQLHLEFQPSLSPAASSATEAGAAAPARRETAGTSALPPLEPLHDLCRTAWQTRIQVAKRISAVTYIASHLQLVSVGSSNGERGASSEDLRAFTSDELCAPVQRVA